MRSLRVKPGGTLQGYIAIPGDKSITHRALILGALAKPNTRVVLHNWLQSLDCLATLNALAALGIQFTHLDPASVQITSVGLYGLQPPQHTLNVANSGTAMRLLTGILAAQKFSSTITGDASLCQRPMARIITPLTQMGAKITARQDNFAPLIIQGGRELRAINYVLPMASAQVKAAILLADLYAQGKSQIIAPTICRDHTEIMLQHFSNQYMIPGDISTAAFFIVGATITPGADIILTNIGVNPTRTAVLEILRKMGGDIVVFNQRSVHGELRADLRVKAVQKLTAITIPAELVANAIDELPILCLAAACAAGTTVIRGAEELRYKESDRIALLAQGLNSLNIEVKVMADGLDITGGRIVGGSVATAGDHRIAMTFAMAGLVAQQDIIVQDTHNIATSFPDFVATVGRAGLMCNEESLCLN